jgi:DNA-binding MarR family transcriptional regulator
MNQDIEKSRDNCFSMVARLVAAARASQNATDLFDETVGQLFGNNRSDGRCADIIQRFGRMTAGVLAQRSGLTTGAVTTVIDRLEKAGYARRVRDKKDRRKVFVELTDFTHQMVDLLFRPMGEVYAGAMQDLSIEDMRIISEYLEFSERINSRYAQILQNHVPLTKTDNIERLQRAKSFAREGKNIADELVKSWGEEPVEPPRTGKNIE